MALSTYAASHRTSHGICTYAPCPASYPLRGVVVTYCFDEAYAPGLYEVVVIRDLSEVPPRDVMYQRYMLCGINLHFFQLLPSIPPPGAYPPAAIVIPADLLCPANRPKACQLIRAPPCWTAAHHRRAHLALIDKGHHSKLWWVAVVGLVAATASRIM